MPPKEEKKHPDPPERIETTPIRTSTTKQVSPAILAARAFNRIEALIDARNAELANAPESISARYAARIETAKEALDPEVRDLLDGMLEKAGHAEAKGGE